MSVSKTTIRKYNNIQSAYNRRLRYRDPAAGGGYRKADTEAISNKGSAAGHQGLQGRAPDTGPARGRRRWQGACGDAHSLRRTGGAAGDTGDYGWIFIRRISLITCGSLGSVWRRSRLLNTVYIL